MNGRIERVDDERERDALRAQARRVRLRAAVAATLLTIGALFLR